MRRIIADYTREAGVRSLERQIGAVLRKIAARVAAAPSGARRGRRSGRHAPRALPDYLGPPRFHDEVAFRVSRPASRPAWRGPKRGGDVLFVEASLLPAGHAQSDSHRPARKRDAGVGARGVQPHPRAARKELGVAPRLSRQSRSARPRAGRRDSEGRTVGRRDDGDGDCVGAAQSDRCARTSR